MNNVLPSRPDFTIRGRSVQKNARCFRFFLRCFSGVARNTQHVSKSTPRNGLIKPNSGQVLILAFKFQNIVFYKLVCHVYSTRAAKIKYCGPRTEVIESTKELSLTNNRIVIIVTNKS